MTDDDITKTQQAVDRTLASIKAACESYIGAPMTRETVETAVSKAMGFPVRFPDWDEATGTATKMVVEPPFKLDYLDVTFVVESEEPPEAPINCSYCMDSGIDPDNGLECAMPAHDPVIVQEGETVQFERLIPVLPEGEVTLPPEIIGVGLYNPHGVSRMFVRGSEE